MVTVPPPPTITLPAPQLTDAVSVSVFLSWVIGVEWQNQGFASEAARALVDWLGHQGADEIVAHVHPGHQASAAVAARAGLHPTDELADGEQVWRANP